MPARHRLGGLHLNILTDGVYSQDAGAVCGVVPRILWERLGIELNARYQMALGLNSLLVSSQGKTVLIETGVGEKERPLGQTERPGGVTLLDELAAIGVAPEDVDVVINTHLHADHCGWNTKKAGDGWSPTFPRARYLIQRGEYDACMHPNERTRATYFAENVEPLADPVQLERAPWVSSFDLYPLEAMETKKAVVQRAIDERQLVVAVHCAFPGLGHMTETADGKRKWVPVAANE